LRSALSLREIDPWLFYTPSLRYQGNFSRRWHSFCWLF
jgi:hypothetical protein